MSCMPRPSAILMARTKSAASIARATAAGRGSASSFATTTSAPSTSRSIRTTRRCSASLWEVYRRPWMLWSGGEGSGLFKSTDGGDHWTEITRNPGLPKTLLGKINVSVSGADGHRVYANIETEPDGGLYRSDDGGATWMRVNEDRNIRQRAFYFNRIQADPNERDTVYAMNVEFWRSTDGGRTLTRLATPHSDHHDLWIAPDNSTRMIAADDGGASVSVNRGQTW